MNCISSIFQVFFIIILLDLQFKEAFNWVAKQPIITWFFSFLISLIIFGAYSLSAKFCYLGFKCLCFGAYPSNA